jgi:hypothetical protein
LSIIDFDATISVCEMVTAGVGAGVRIGVGYVTQYYQHKQTHNNNNNNNNVIYGRRWLNFKKQTHKLVNNKQIKNMSYKQRYCRRWVRSWWHWRWRHWRWL